MLVLEELITRLKKLPGLGPRSARRLALYLLKKREHLLKPLIESLTHTYTQIKECSTCFNLDSYDPCYICCDTKRHLSTLCIISDVVDLWALERTACFKGRYHVLGGLLSAVDGVGPDKLHLPELAHRLSQEVYTEVVFAFNATVDAQTTMHYIMSQFQHTSLKFTCLAKGVPLGGEIDYLDDATLSIALQGRQLV